MIPSKTLLVIQAHGGTEPHLQRHWPYYKATGLDILGVDRVDGPVRWPEAIPTFSVGRNLYICKETGNMNRLVVETFRHCLGSQWADYSDFLMIEYDCVLLSKPPPHPGGFASAITAFPPPEWQTKAKRCLGTPWWPDRAACLRFVEEGEKLLAAGQYDNGSCDCYCGLIMDLARIPFSPVNAFHRNTLDMRLPRLLNECREAIRNGAWMIHGFRDGQHLDYVLGKIPLSEVRNLL